MVFVTQSTLTNPCISGSDLIDQINESFHVSICPSTINSMRHKSGFKFLPPVKEPLLSQIRKRIDFCYSVLLNKKRLPNIGFSYESRFCLGSDNRFRLLIMILK